MSIKQVKCHCPNQSCFLREDIEWMKQNFNKFKTLERLCTNNHEFKVLESERLERKSCWLSELGVYGTQEVSCCKK